jgi:hypothetical protein
MRTEDQIAWHRDQMLTLQEAIRDVSFGYACEPARLATLSAMRSLLDLHRQSKASLEAEFEKAHAHAH